MESRFLKFVAASAVFMTVLLDLIVVAITSRLVPWSEIVAGVPGGSASPEAEALQ